MTCKDCLHYEACKSLLEAMWYTVDGDGENADKRCDTFTDRSRYVVREKGEWQRVIPTKSAAKWSNKVACSVCHSAGHIRKNFCPNCGADMRKGENG